MTAELPAKPEHPMDQLTTFELRDYRRLLEQALGDQVIGQAPVATTLRMRLDAVVAEQEERDRIRHGRQPVL